MTDPLENARHEVLAENTAQAVHKHLTLLFREEVRFRSRWIWELLQNARDAAPAGGIRVWLVHEPHRVVFRHDGAPFAEKGIAHLIYHGSTKYESGEGGPVGQFGTGFLTTHLISKTVTVTGRTADEKVFHFVLDRRGENADELKRAMDASWDAFKRSLTSVVDAAPHDHSTEYEYPIADDPIVATGITDLMESAACVLAFNGRIRSIHVSSPRTGMVSFERNGGALPTTAVSCASFTERHDGRLPEVRYVASIQQAGTCVAVEVKEQDSRLAVAERGKPARIFVAFPLVGTRDFCLPVIVNDEALQPREERDTLPLTKRSDCVTPNMLRLEAACDLAVRLTAIAAQENWRGAPLLTRLSPIREWDWVDLDWCRESLKKRFIAPLRAAPLMTAISGERVPLSEARVPICATSGLRGRVWRLASGMRSLAGVLPREDEQELWSDTLLSWSQFLSVPPEEFAEALTLARLCESVASLTSVQALSDALASDRDVFEWLNDLYGLLVEATHPEVLTRNALVPSQTGELKKHSELKLDEDIDPELKNIGEKLGIPVRSRLIDTRIRLKSLVETQSMTEGEVLSALLQRATQLKPVAAAENVLMQFFSWLVRHDELESIDGFPIVTRATHANEPVLAALGRDPGKTEDTLLGPVACWPSAFRAIADLFPKQRTFADAYAEILPDESAWQKLAAQGLVRLSPLYSARRRVLFLPDEPLPELDKKVRHRTTEGVPVSVLAFFDKEGAGVDIARHSRTRGVSLLLFIADHVLHEHPDALRPVQGDCECGSKHHYYPSAWIEPLCERRWVSVGEGKHAPATADAIAQLFEGREAELRQLVSGGGRLLLKALGITLSDLTLRSVAKDESTLISLLESLQDILHASGDDPARVKLVAQELKESPDLVEEARKRRETREKVLRNQAFGAEVERLLQEALRDEQLRVERTGVGSDYEVEEDYVSNDSELLIAVGGPRRSFLVEVKATTTDTVRMTVRQAETAATNRERFILCVVPTDTAHATPELVRKRCRFIMCGFRPSRSAIPADADHPFRQGDHPGRDAAG